MKRFCKIFASWFFCLFLVLSQFIVSLADVKSLMIGSDSNALMVYTDSNALMTMELDDSDYAVIPMSALGSVTNTVNLENVVIAFYVVNPATNAGYTINKSGSIENNKLHVVVLDSELLDGYYIANIQMILKNNLAFTNGGALPPPGNYKFSFDMTNEFSYALGGGYLRVVKATENAANLGESISLDGYATASSGEIYCSGFIVDLLNVDVFSVIYNVADYASARVRNLDSLFSFSFIPTSESSNVTAGIDTSTQDYENNVSSSLSGLSSSVDTMTDEISGVTEAIQNLQGAMEPHYSNVLTQLHHITEQLHAFYDQVYNNIHLPELSMLTQIKEAIENIDLQIEVDISEVKTAINNMSTAVQNKLQSTTDQITGGYDNSSMSSDKSELDGVLDQYEQAEEQLFDDAKGHINDFEFDTPLDSFTGPLADVSYFLNGMFEAMGPMNVVISFSLTLTIAMVMIGWYRFKGGR